MHGDADFRGSCAGCRVWCALSSRWCALFGFWCALFLDWCAVFGFWCALFLDWCAAFGFWCADCHVWCALFFVWCATLRISCALIPGHMRFSIPAISSRRSPLAPHEFNKLIWIYLGINKQTCYTTVNYMTNCIITVSVTI